MRAAARVAAAGLALVAACTGPGPAAAPEARPWPEAEAAFRTDPRWLGGDACYSVPLGEGRILWLFGDSFVDPAGSGDRRRSRMVRNTLAIQHGADPAAARVTFHWGEAGDGAPAAFFADDGEHGYWPLHGVRLEGGPLLLFQTVVRATPGEGLGFAIDGWRIRRIDGVDGEPARWRATALRPPPTPFPCTVGTAVWRDGDHVVALGTGGGAVHTGLLCRFAVADLLADRVAPQWWNGSAWAPADAAPGPAFVMPEAGPECSLHRERDGSWLHVTSRGFGATTLALRSAPAPQGPWGELTPVYTPPESRGPRPFVYAGKAHPELDAGPGWLAVTYAANAWDFAALFTPDGQRELYWPRFVRLRRR